MSASRKLQQRSAVLCSFGQNRSFVFLKGTVLADWSRGLVPELTREELQLATRTSRLLSLPRVTRIHPRPKLLVDERIVMEGIIDDELIYADDTYVRHLRDPLSPLRCDVGGHPFRDRESAVLFASVLAALVAIDLVPNLPVILLRGQERACRIVADVLAGLAFGSVAQVASTWRPDDEDEGVSGPLMVVDDGIDVTALPHRVVLVLNPIPGVVRSDQRIETIWLSDVHLDHDLGDAAIGAHERQCVHMLRRLAPLARASKGRITFPTLKRFVAAELAREESPTTIDAMSSEAHRHA